MVGDRFGGETACGGTIENARLCPIPIGVILFLALLPAACG